MFDEEAMPGVNVALWNGVDERGFPVADGIYFYRVEGAEASSPGRVLLVRGDARR